jgi:hypothetical protein
MPKPHKPWQVHWSRTDDDPAEFTSQSQAYSFIGGLRHDYANGDEAIRHEVIVFEHDGTRWALYERVDLKEG